MSEDGVLCSSDGQPVVDEATGVPVQLAAPNGMCTF